MSIITGLNPQQETAVKADFNRHFLVLAGAGCGKTTVLTRRIAWCAETFCSQERILALTFTRKAAGEMRERTAGLDSIRKNAVPPCITTFHGFGLRVMHDVINGRRNSALLGFSVEPRLINGAERLELLAKASTRSERSELGVDILHLDNIIACREADSDIWSKTEEKQNGIIAHIFNRYENLKLEENAWEFTDMISRTVSLFEQFPDVRNYYAHHFRHIMVDEFQDTSPLQIRMLDLLLSCKANVFAVGDDDQAIYGFRGADIRPTLNFTSRFKGAGLLKLEINYRSRPAILKAANRIFAKKAPEYRKVLLAGRCLSTTAGFRKQGFFCLCRNWLSTVRIRRRGFRMTSCEHGRRPQKINADSQEDMALRIMTVCRRIEEEASIPVTEMCLLFRLNETLDRAIVEFGKQNPAAQVPQMMTVHASKGLEFPVVFLCDLEEGQFPNYKRRAGIRTWTSLVFYILRRKKKTVHFDLGEEKRLFYVGVTRAQELLFLVSCRSKIHLGRTIQLYPSRFLRLV
jgi:superfamily I DNA/RNA helicase